MVVICHSKPREGMVVELQVGCKLVIEKREVERDGRTKICIFQTFLSFYCAFLLNFKGKIFKILEIILEIPSNVLEALLFKVLRIAKVVQLK
jgi:hypothetical protein